MPTEKPSNFTHHINLDERGSYYADVRDHKGNTVFTIKAGNELEEGESDIFEDGFMVHKNDMEGLKSYLVSLSIMDKDDTLINLK